MKCDVCDQEFASSEDLSRHVEQAHPMGDDEGEKPDLMDRPNEGATPETAERRPS